MKSEKEKMLAGELYRPLDPILTQERLRARRLTRWYNQTAEDESEKRLSILHELFGQLVSKVEIEPPFYCDYGYNIIAGDNLFINFNCVILDCATVTIGNNVMFGPAVQIYTAYHPLEAALRNSGQELAAPVKIGDNVWLGGGAIINPGITIGNNSIIGAGSVATKNIPDNVVAVGNPCKIIKQL